MLSTVARHNFGELLIEALAFSLVVAERDRDAYRGLLRAARAGGCTPATRLYKEPGS
jgi:hypothetical protein